MRVVALLTSHNRRDATLRCLRSYFSQEINAPVALTAVLVDDASTDGTPAQVRREFPEVHVVQGSGCLYWAGGMALAQRVAASSDPDYFLWLNDDVRLSCDALSRLLSTERAAGKGRSIVVGALRDPRTGELTYSGVRKRGLRLHPLRVEMVKPSHGPQLVETFHGNVVLVSRRAATAVGSIDGDFSHAQADFDYGFRARKAGLVNLLAPGLVGTCARDGIPAPWLDRSLPLSQRFQILFGRKGLPPRSAARYLKRHGGRLWPVFWLAPYVRAALGVISSLGARDHRDRGGLT